METKEVKRLLQLYFNGESSDQDERTLEMYFQSENIADEVNEYAEFFGGISELANENNDSSIEEDIMNYILEHEHREKTKYRQMWRWVTSVAATIIIVLGSFLIYQQQHQAPFKDTFDDPDEAYAYAEQTLQFVSSKYNKGLAALANFDKLQKAEEPLKKGIVPLNDFFNTVKKMEDTN